MRDWEVSQFLFADDVVSTEERLNKVLVCSREGGRAELRVRLNGELLEEVELFKYLGSVISNDTGVSMDVRQIVSEGAATYGVMKSIWRVNKIGMRANKGLYESIVVPTVLYGG